MQTKHPSPEFEVICQKQANAKFFVASFEIGSPTTGTTDVASQYTESQTTIGSDAAW